MALNKGTAGEKLHLGNNMQAVQPVGSYTTPAYGDLLKRDTSGNDLVNRCASGDAPIGLVDSTNRGNGMLTMAEFKQNVHVILDYTGALSLGDKVVSNGDKGTVDTTRDRVKRDNSLGVGSVLALDNPTTGQCVVAF